MGEEIKDFVKAKGVALTDECHYLNQWYEVVDVDKDGKVSRDEIKVWAEANIGVAGALRALQGDGSVEDACKAWIEKADLNGDGTLTRDEVYIFSAWKGNALRKEQIAELYEAADSNKDGKLTLDEIKAWAETALAAPAAAEEAAAEPAAEEAAAEPAAE